MAYSFQPCFVVPIRAGLGIGLEAETCRPKRQTIRAIGKRRHAEPGEQLQLYCRQRSPQGFLIGRAPCIGWAMVRLRLGRRVSTVYIGAGAGETPWHNQAVDTAYGLDRFAQADGFVDWAALREFWRVHHPHVTEFTGRITFWEPEHGNTVPTSV